MAEFWPENQNESSCAKVVKSSSNAQLPVAGSQSSAEDPPTVLSSSKVLLATFGSSPEIARELAGEMLGHFRLDDYVAVGGMGAVFRATDLRLDRSVALKILPPDQAKDPEIVQRFQDEARAAARLDHENIARAYFVGEDRGLHFIAFEFVEGVNIREVIGQCGALPPHEVVNYALQIAGALVHAASRGVVHRDIKPSNIIITMAGRAKLVDMGLARNFERRHDGGPTQSNITLGTFDYIAPEQARDPRSADARSDIYSLGCTLFHMLTGRPPYPEGTLLQKLLKHQAESPPDPRDLNPQVPAQLATTVQRMMAKDPSRRQQNPQLLLSEFLEIAADMGLRSTSPEGLIWVSDRSGASLSKLTGAIWLTAAAVLILAVWRLYATSIAAPVAITRTVQPEVLAGSAADRQTPSNLQSAEVSGRAHGVDLPEADGRRPEDSRTGSQNQDESANLDGPALDPEVFVVGPDQDLRSVLADAPSGSVIELTGEHRPQLMHKVDDTAGIRIEGKRLTIKAAPGSRPRLVLSYDSQAFGVADWNLLTIVNGQLELEGIHFEIQAASMPNTSMAMITCQSSQVILRRCSFFQTWAVASPEQSRRDDEASVWVAQLDRGIGLDRQLQSAKVTASECFFGGGDGAFRLAGSARTELTDCVVLPYRSTFLIRSAGLASSPPADVRLNNVSLFGGGNPIFDLGFARAAVSSQGVVFSHEAPAAQGVLARVDADSRLDWKGKRNIYHGLRQYLVARGVAGLEPLARRLSDWLELSSEVDEQDSIETETTPWLLTLAEAASRSTGDSHIADAFRIARRTDDPNWRPVGSRYVLPWGALYAEPVDSTAAQRVKQFARGNGTLGTTSNDLPRPNSTSETRNDKPAKSDSNAFVRSNAESSNSGGGAKLEENMKKIINTMPTTDAASVPQDANSANTRSTADVSTTAVGSRDTLVVDPQHPGAFSTIAAACARAEDGAVIEIRYSGRLREGPIELGDRHLTIRASAGYRPIIDFSVSQFDLRGREPRLFDIRRGSLTLKDLDLHLMADAAVSSEPWAAVACRGADLQMDGCTVTVEAGAGVTSSVVRFLTSDVEDPMTAPAGETTPVRPQFQLRNSFAVGTSQLVRIQPAVRVRMEIENCALEVQENLIAVLGGMDRAIIGSVNEIEIRHATVRMRNGLISYEANESRGWLARLEITTADNLFVSETDAPWIRFRSPRPADELRGLLRWKGMNNSYDGVTTFWQIDSMTSGEFELLSWDEWTRSPARDEIKADRGRIEFATMAANTQPWQHTRYHFKPVPVAAAGEMASDGSNRGADLNLIPPPPQERENGTR
jgi:serine/threonine-protein kinase